jgi:hypothetical protein
MHVQEPVFVPRPGSSAEDGGWLLVLVFASASQRTELAILDAQKLSEGPVATIKLPHHIPMGRRACRCWHSAPAYCVQHGHTSQSNAPYSTGLDAHCSINDWQAVGLMRM